jgi:hypothetical protein
VSQRVRCLIYIAIAIVLLNIGTALAIDALRALGIWQRL